MLLAAGKLLETARQRRKCNSLTVPEASAQAPRPHCLWAAGEVPSVAAGGGCLLVAAKKQRERKGLNSSQPL